MVSDSAFDFFKHRRHLNQPACNRVLQAGTEYLEAWPIFRIKVPARVDQFSCKFGEACGHLCFFAIHLFTHLNFMRKHEER